MSAHEISAGSSFPYSSQPDNIELSHQIVGLIGVTILGVLFGIKTYDIDFKFLSLSKLLVILLYVCSWAFLFSGLPVIATNNGNFTSCMLANIGCDLFYTGTKVFIYSWLIEKVWIVGANNKPRLRSKTYRFHLLLLLPYAGIMAFMVGTHKTRIGPDGTCTIGIHISAAYLLIIYDFIINLYMTILFVRPLMKMHKDIIMDHRASRLQDVAKRTLVASVVCLFASFGNILILILFNAEARGAICLMCCFVDVLINTLTIHWVTSQPNGRKGRHDTSDLKNTSLTTDNAAQSHSNNMYSGSSQYESKSKSDVMLKEDHEFNNFELSDNLHFQQAPYQTPLSPSPPLASNQVLTYAQIMQSMDESDQQQQQHETAATSPFEEFDMKDYTPTKRSSSFNPYNPHPNSSTTPRPIMANEHFNNNENEDFELHSSSRRSSVQESYSSKIFLT
ncbi:hypothetical protein BJ944DRAFT_244803 [Cunninghamella echinulata]|nr:hypothetical protein BJ944DRAFT_244803 [Cunninghamella echinulata]